jgi:hypothetical protein
MLHASIWVYCMQIPKYTKNVFNNKTENFNHRRFVCILQNQIKALEIRGDDHFSCLKIIIIFLMDRHARRGNKNGNILRNFRKFQLIIITLII